MSKPQLIEFFVRGYPLEDALAILNRWGRLTKSERELATHARWEVLTERQKLKLNPCVGISGCPAGYQRH